MQITLKCYQMSKTNMYTPSLTLLRHVPSVEGSCCNKPTSGLLISVNCQAGKFKSRFKMETKRCTSVSGQLTRGVLLLVWTRAKGRRRIQGVGKWRRTRRMDAHFLFIFIFPFSIHSKNDDARARLDLLGWLCAIDSHPLPHSMV
jgi:hypothetical protein